jgi:hypothetical protein
LAQEHFGGKGKAGFFVAFSAVGLFKKFEYIHGVFENKHIRSFVKLTSTPN